MTRATVEESTASRGPALRTGRPLAGGLPFHGTYAARRHAGPQHEKATDAGLGLLLWVSDFL